MVANRLSIIISMISACFMVPQLVGNIFLVLISKPVRICFAKANRMIQVRSVITKNSIKKMPYVVLFEKTKGARMAGKKRQLQTASSPHMCGTVMSSNPCPRGRSGVGNPLSLLLPASQFSPFAPKTPCSLPCPNSGDLATDLFICKRIS